MIPISDENVETCSQLVQRMQQAGIRATLDARGETLNYRIRDGEVMKVPYMAVVGKREAEGGTIALRIRGAGKKQDIVDDRCVHRSRARRDRVARAGAQHRGRRRAGGRLTAACAAPARGGRWRDTLAGRWGQLLVGLVGFGVAITLMIRSGLGLGPWDAFHVGVSLWTPLSVGVASMVTGLVVLAGSLLLGVRPGLGTLANMVLIGLVIDALLPVVPTAHGWVAGLAYFLPALVLFGPCTGMYIGARLGSGPRDGLMLAVAARTGWPVRRVRTIIELSALGAGWAMGGTIGVGTLLFAVGAGPAAQWGLRLFGVLPARA